MVSAAAIAHRGSVGAGLTETTRLADTSPEVATQAPAPDTATDPASASPTTTTRSWPTQAATAPPPARIDPPRRLSLPRLGLDLPVEASGVDGRGEMALPAHPDTLGWYAFGAAPGSDHGVSVFGGHIDSFRYGTGPLVDLVDARVGDTVIVRTRSDTYRYRVVAVQRISKRSLDPAAVFDRTGPPMLRLLTCGGRYLPARGGYQDNLVVTATRQ